VKEKRGGASTLDNVTRIISGILKGEKFSLSEIRHLRFERNRHGLTIVKAAAIKGDFRLWYDLLTLTTVDVNEKVDHRSQLWWARHHRLNVIEEMLLRQGAEDDLTLLNPWVSLKMALRSIDTNGYRTLSIQFTS
jgi:hypothetical protein